VSAATRYRIFVLLRQAGDSRISFSLGLLTVYAGRGADARPGRGLPGDADLLVAYFLLPPAGAAEEGSEVALVIVLIDNETDQDVWRGAV
jgi:hypothetical protein